MHHLVKPMKAQKSECHIFFLDKLLICLYYSDMTKEMKKLMEINEQKSMKSAQKTVFIYDYVDNHVSYL